MKHTRIALIFIANFAAATLTFAQNAPQTGLPTDARTAVQKAQADANIRRDTKLADTMEKDRLKAEAQARPYTPPQTQAKAAQDTASAPVSKKATKKKKKEPDYFTAQVPGEGKAKKIAKKPAKSSRKKDA